jgi:aspartyl-tRNA(Asn)/glutamyl-tRNA(Gln) amidotransferase subunit B
MNSFRAVEKAVEYEIARQIDCLTHGEAVVQETRLWDPEREETRSMRSKESAHDYRYFPEPDLLPLEVSADWVAAVAATLPELPDARRERFVRQYGLPPYDAEVLTARKDLADYFEAAVDAHPNAKAISNWVMGDLLRLVRERKLDQALVIRDWLVAPAQLASLVALIDDATISGKIAKTVFEQMVASGESPQAIVAAQGLSQVTDSAAIDAAVAAVLAANPDKVAEYRAGKDKLFGFFVGQVMKAMHGKGNPQLVNERLRQHLAS